MAQFNAVLPLYYDRARGQLTELDPSATLDIAGVTNPNFTIAGKYPVTSVLPPSALGPVPISWNHVQNTAASTWTITHNQNLWGFVAKITDLTMTHEMIPLGVIATTANEITVTWSAPQQGIIEVMLHTNTPNSSS